MWRSIAVSLLLCVAGRASASNRPQYGGTLRVETQAGPDALVHDLVFDRLTRISAKGDIAPSLAVRWTQDNNAQRWQFWLRPGVHFHDGTDLTADDVARSLNDACPSLCPWRSVRALGSSVVITLDSPAPTLPAELARAAYIVTHKDTNGELDGTGPFRITVQTRDHAALAAVNDAWAGRPFLDSIEIDGRRDPRVQLLDLSVGRADIVDLQPESVRQAEQAHLAVAQSAPVDLIALQIHTPALSTSVQRAAISLALDRAAIWTVIYQKQGEATASLLPNALSGYSFLFSTQRNLARATELAAAVRAPLALTAESSDPAIQLAAGRIALNLRDAGINIQVKPPNSPNADITLRHIHLEAADARAALHQALRQFGTDSDDDDGSPASLYRVEKSFLDDHTVIPLVWLPRAYAISARVRDLALSADGTPLLADVSLKVDQP